MTFVHQWPGSTDSTVTASHPNVVVIRIVILRAIIIRIINGSFKALRRVLNRAEYN